MNALAVSFITVAIAEIGDRTQLLALILAARFGRPWTILAGILCATLANHALASAVGFFITDWIDGQAVRIAIALSFILMGAWTLVPDKLDDGEDAHHAAGGVFVATLTAFFLVEMGDKTQIATAALAARFRDILMVTAGTTLGMMAANAPAVFFGKAAVRIVPLGVVRVVAATVFVAIGLWALWDALR